MKRKIKKHWLKVRGTCPSCKAKKKLVIVPGGITSIVGCTACWKQIDMIFGDYKQAAREGYQYGAF